MVVLVVARHGFDADQWTSRLREVRLPASSKWKGGLNKEVWERMNVANHTRTKIKMYMYLLFCCTALPV